MKLYIYKGLLGEEAPKDVTHVIVDDSVTIIKNQVFQWCKHLVSVIMGDNVKRIEGGAFIRCRALRFIRLSKTLEHIGTQVFVHCRSLEALFLPSTLKSIGREAFTLCRSLRLFILPNDIDLNNAVSNNIISGSAIEQNARAAGVEYEWKWNMLTTESSRQVNEWLVHHMDEAPFHKLCYSSSITTKQLNNYLNEHGNDLALTIDPIHGMTPMHMLSMNPHAPGDFIAALLNVDVEVAFRLDKKGKISLDYARDYNVDGLIATISSLCNHSHAA